MKELVNSSYQVDVADGQSQPTRFEVKVGIFLSFSSPALISLGGVYYFMSVLRCFNKSFDFLIFWLKNNIYASA